MSRQPVNDDNDSMLDEDDQSGYLDESNIDLLLKDEGEIYQLYEFTEQDELFNAEIQAKAVLSSMQNMPEIPQITQTFQLAESGIAVMPRNNKGKDRAREKPLEEKYSQYPLDPEYLYPNYDPNIHGSSSRDSAILGSLSSDLHPSSLLRVLKKRKGIEERINEEYRVEYFDRNLNIFQNDSADFFNKNPDINSGIENDSGIEDFFYQLELRDKIRNGLLEVSNYSEDIEYNDSIQQIEEDEAEIILTKEEKEFLSLGIATIEQIIESRKAEANLASIEKPIPALVINDGFSSNQGGGSYQEHEPMAKFTRRNSQEPLQLPSDEKPPELIGSSDDESTKGNESTSEFFGSGETSLDHVERLSRSEKERSGRF